MKVGKVGWCKSLKRKPEGGGYYAKFISVRAKAH